MARCVCLCSSLSSSLCLRSWLAKSPASTLHRSRSQQTPHRSRCLNRLRRKSCRWRASCPIDVGSGEFSFIYVVVLQKSSTCRAPSSRLVRNTRVIAQKDLETFREEIDRASSDPYSILLRASKVPYGLLVRALIKKKSIFFSVLRSKLTRI